MKTATAPLPPLRSVKVLDQLRERIRYLHYSYQPNRLMSTGFVPSSVSTVCVTRQPWATAKSRHFCPGWRTSARFRSPRIVRHWRPCCSSTARCCNGSALASGDRKTSAVAALAGGADPDEVVRILGFLEGEHRLFAQLLYGTGMRISEGLQLRVKDGFRSRHDHRAGGQGLQGSGLDVTRELGTQPARAAVACTGMVAEGPGRGAAAALRFPTPLSGSIRAPGIPGRGSGFCAAHAFDRSTERCRASPSHV